MSGITKPYISNGITDLELRKSLDSIIRTLDALDVSITNEDPNTSKTRGGRLHYNAATSNLFVFNKGAWNPVSADTFEHIGETFLEVNSWDSSAGVGVNNNRPATPVGGTYTFSSAVEGSVTTHPTGAYLYPNGRTDVLQWIPRSSVTGAAGKLVYKCTSIVVSDSTTGVVTPLAWSEPVFQPSTTFLGLTKLQRVTVYYWGQNTPGTGADNANVITNCTVTGTLNWATGVVSNVLGPDDTNNSGVSGKWDPAVPTRNVEQSNQGRQYSATLLFKDETGVAATSDASVSVIYRGTSFDGMVTFTDYSSSSGDRFGNQTTIHGGRIQTNTIETQQLSATTKRTLGYSTIITSGAGQSPPATRSDGSALEIGDTYYDTTNDYQYMYYQTTSQSSPQWNRLSIFADSIDVNFLNAQTIVADRIQTGTLSFKSGNSASGALFAGGGVFEQITSDRKYFSSIGTISSNVITTMTARNNASFGTRMTAFGSMSYRGNTSSNTTGIIMGMLNHNTGNYSQGGNFSITHGHANGEYVSREYSTTFVATKGHTYSLTCHTGGGGATAAGAMSELNAAGMLIETRGF